MSLLDNLSSNGAAPAIYEGTIAEDAVTVNDELYVIVPDYDPGRQFGPVKFVAQPRADAGGVLLPTRGDWCLVSFDADDNAQLLSWRTDDPTGSVTPPTSVIDESLNVDDFPYNGDAQAAIDAAATALGGNGGRVFAPGAVRDFSTPLNIPNFVEFYGIGQGSILRAAGNNYVLAFAPGNRSHVHDFTIMAASRQTAGGGIDFSAAQHNIHVTNLYFSYNLFIGMNVSPNQSGGIYWFDNIRWDGVINSGTALVIGGGSGLVTDVRTRAMVGTADPAAGSMGLWVSIPKNADTIIFTDSEWITGTLGVQIGTVAQVTNVGFNSCVVDGMTGVGVNVVNARVLKWLAGQISSCGGTAGFIIGAGAKHVGLDSATVQNCGQDGVDIINGSLDSSVINCDIFDNNQSNTANRFGIGVAANASDFTLALNRIGNGRGILPAGFQKYPIQIATGSSDRYVVTGNRGFGNITSDTVVDNGTGTVKDVSGNVP